MNRKLELALAVVIIVAAGVFLYRAHLDVVRNAVTDAQINVGTQVEKAIDQALAARDDKYRDEREALLQKFQKTESGGSAALVAALNAALAQAGKPPIVIQPAPVATSSPGAPAAAPPPSTVSVPLPSLGWMNARVDAGELCALDLAKCQGDRNDWQAKFDRSEQSLQLSEAARHGGTKRQKTLKVFKCIGMGGGGAGLGALIGGNRGAAIGGAAGAGACAITF